MECPICFYHFRPPIYQCVGGHSFCSQCVKKLVKCPTCMGQMTTTRNFTLESVVTEVLCIPCPNSEKGCAKLLFEDELPSHQRICDYRIYVCPMQSINTCEWKGNRGKLYEHVQQKHHWNTQKRFYMYWTATHPEYSMSFHYIHGQMFYFYRLLKNQTLYWAIQYIGPLEEAGNYSYDLTIAKKMSAIRKLVISQVCFDDSLSPEGIIDAGFCVGVPVPALRPYFKEEGKFLCSIEVKAHQKLAKTAKE